MSNDIRPQIESANAQFVTAFKRGDATAGRAAFVASCAVCHEPAAAARPSIASVETIARSDWTVKGCIADNRGKAPDLRLSEPEKALLLARACG